MIHLMNHPAAGAVDGSPAERPVLRSQLRLEASTLGLLAGWVATWSWSGMVVRPAGFLVPALLVGALVVLAGAGLSRLPVVPAYGVAVGQVLVALLGLNAAVAGRLSVAGILPTLRSTRAAAMSVLDGAATLNTYSAPVSVNVHDSHALLLAASLGVLLVVELMITAWRRPSAVALPLLVTLAVPVSVLENALTLPVFVGTSLLFIRLLGTRLTTEKGSERASLGVLWEVGVAAVLVALLLSPVVPVTNLLARGQSQSSSGPGNGNDYTVASVDPFVRLRRDLVARTHTPMVYARTDAPRTSYLRTTVLDVFTPSGWEASTRRLPASNIADGPFPPPPGLAPSATRRHHTWQLELAPDFLTTWLPLPYPLRSVHVDGDWRYDERTLDVTILSPVATSGLKYSADAFDPDIDARLLRGAISPPASVQVPNTQLPKDVPPILEQQARTVTRGATSNFERAVALQEWFRSRGGFTYSLAQRPGSGLDLLAHFVTDDRVGYCEQYAAAMAAMGRLLGIPSRVVVGFLDGTTQPDGRVLYTSDDRHAWPEMYFSGVGWVRFEPTPSERAGASPPWTRQDLSAEATRRAEPRPRRAAVPANAPDGTAGGGAGDRALPWRPLTGIVVVGLLGALPAVVRRVQRRRRLGGTDSDRLLEGAWAELGATAVDLGVYWPADRSPREQARQLGEQVPAARRRIREPVGDLLVAVERSRYGPPGSEPLTAAQREHTLENLAEVRDALRDGTRKERGWWSRWWPASVWPASWRRPGGVGARSEVRKPRSR